MAEAVEHSFQYLTAGDLGAVATFIQTVPASGNMSAPNRFSAGKPGSQLAHTRGVATSAGDAATHGAMLFQGSCGSCHGALGQGTKDGAMPSLFHNSVVGAANSNLVATILNGVQRNTKQSDFFMPGFGGTPSAANQLSDHEVALIATYVRTEYGGALPAVTDQDVAVIRRGGPSSPLLLLARSGLGLGMVVILATVLFLRRRRRRSRQAASA